MFTFSGIVDTCIVHIHTYSIWNSNYTMSCIHVSVATICSQCRLHITTSNITHRTYVCHNITIHFCLYSTKYSYPPLMVVNCISCPCVSIYICQSCQWLFKSQMFKLFTASHLLLVYTYCTIDWGSTASDITVYYVIVYGRVLCQYIDILW